MTDSAHDNEPKRVVVSDEYLKALSMRMAVRSVELGAACTGSEVKTLGGSECDLRLASMYFLSRVTSVALGMYAFNMAMATKAERQETIDGLLSGLRALAERNFDLGRNKDVVDVVMAICPSVNDSVAAFDASVEEKEAERKREIEEVRAEEVVKVMAEELRRAMSAEKREN